MESLLLILVFGGVLGLILVYKQQNHKEGNGIDNSSEGLEE